MLLKLLWISGLWLGIGLAAGLALWVLMALAKRTGGRQAAAVRPVPDPVPEPPRAPFEVLAGGGGPKPMRLAKSAVDRRSMESQLISAPGSRR